MEHTKMTIDELVIVPEYRERATAMLESFTSRIKDLPTFINRYNIGGEIQKALAKEIASAIVLHTTAVVGNDEYGTAVYWEDVLVLNAVGAKLTDYLNTEIRPGAIREEKEREAAKVASMTPSQRDQYQRAKDNPFLKFLGGDPEDAIDEPGTGGTFDA